VSTPGVVDLAALRRLWNDVLDAVKLRSRTAHALMFSSQIEGLEGKHLTLLFSTATLARRFDDVADFVTEAIREVVGQDLVVKAVTAPGPGAASGGTGRRPATVALPDPEPEDLVVDDDASSTEQAERQDPQAAAMALLQQGLGATVIGEIDHS
jgi:hypothetical protein